MNTNNKKLRSFFEKTVVIRLLLSAVIYLAMIGVVIYGMGHYVYDGFGMAVPVLICILFAVMAVIRFRGFLTAAKAANSLDRFLRFRRSDEYAETISDSDYDRID